MAKKQLTADAQVLAFAARIFLEFKSKLGDRFKKFKANEVKLIKGIALETAYLNLKALAGENVDEGRQRINAQLANLFSAAQGEAVTLFWQSFWMVARASLHLAAPIPL